MTARVDKSQPIPRDARATVVLSSLATRTSSRRAKQALKRLQQWGWRLELVETRAPGHATEIAAEAVRRNDDVVVAAGGDGTINEVIQALAHSETALGVLPLGLENIWAKEIGIGSDVQDAARCLTDGQCRRVDLGQAGSRYFLLMASLGIDSLIVQEVTRESKLRLGETAYLLTGLKMLASFRGVDIAVSLGDRSLRRRALLVVVGNTRLYAGRVRITPEARVDDSLLDICLFNQGDLLTQSRYVVSVLAGLHLGTPGIEYFRAPKLTIEANPEWPVQADGDIVGSTPMLFRSVPQALRAIVPRGRNIPLFGSAEC